MRQTTLAALAALLLCLAAPQARADLVIDGRAAQALHCSAMLFMVSHELHKAGYIDRRTRDSAQLASLRMLEFVPGTDAQRGAAMRQRFERTLRTRTLAQLFAEYDSTRRWCERAFLR